MLKKIFWPILAILLITFGVLWKFYYPGSQLEMKRVFRDVEATPVEYYYSAEEPSCGIWYENPTNEEVPFGKSNERVLSCFHRSFEECNSSNIMTVKHLEGKTVYSLVRILRGNDLDKCIIQNYYEEKSDFVDENFQPISYINTCTVLSEDIYNSCEPKYIKELRRDIERNSN